MRHRRNVILRALLLPLAIAALPPPASAQIVDSRATTADLVGICADAKAMTLLACSGFLSGAVEGLLMGQLVASDAEPSFCLPEESIRVAELRTMFLGFVAERPELLAHDASLVLLDALEAHFPCEDAEEPLPGTDALTMAANHDARSVRGARHGPAVQARMR